MAARKGPVGLGYLPKGGRQAGAAHNERVQGRVESAPAVAVQPDSDGADVRGSARPFWPLRVDQSVVYGAAAGGSAALLVEAVRVLAGL